MINPVAPVEGHYALLRNGMVARPMLDDWPENPPYFDAYLEIYWYRDGTAQPATKAEIDVRHAPKYDIIATISPADMQAVASGELERLRTALGKAEIEREYWRGFAVQTKQQVEGFVKKLQDWTNEGELIQGGYNAGT